MLARALADDELDEFREQVRHFAQNEVAPHAALIDESNDFPVFPDGEADLWKKLGDFGLHGLTVPEEKGGLGLGYAYHCVAMEELSRASGAVALSYGAHSNLCINQITRHATEGQAERFLPKLISGENVGALAMSEPGSGSDVVSMSCQARETESGDFVLNGNKMWCTNGTVADTLVVYAKTDAAAKQRGITAFLIEKGGAPQPFQRLSRTAGRIADSYCTLLTPPRRHGRLLHRPEAGQAGNERERHVRARFRGLRRTP